MAGFEAFANKRLCDVVFPGTHDAGTTHSNRYGAGHRQVWFNRSRRPAPGSAVVMEHRTVTSGGRVAS